MLSVLVCIGKLCAALAFGAAYLYCVELYTTSLRATCMGTASTIGRLGGIFALSIEGLKVYWAPLPFVLIGIMGMVAAAAAITFPETTGEKLPDTVAESLEMGKNYKLVPCCRRRTEEQEPIISPAVLET